MGNPIFHHALHPNRPDRAQSLRYCSAGGRTSRQVLFDNRLGDILGKEQHKLWKMWRPCGRKIPARRAETDQRGVGSHPGGETCVQLPTPINIATTAPTIQRELQDMWTLASRSPRINNDWLAAIDAARQIGFTKMVLIVGGTMHSVPDRATYASTAGSMA